MMYLYKFIILTAIILAGFQTETQAQYHGHDKVKKQENGQALPGDNISVRQIERAVFKQLLRLPYYSVFDHIAFSVDGDTVNLTGKVAVARNRKDAERVVKRIAGVGHVVNNIETLPPSPFDDRIRRRVFRTIAGSGGLFRYLREPNPSVRLIVDRGHIELEGFVANRGDYNLMNVLANGVTDVFSVKNNLIVEKEMVR